MHVYFIGIGGIGVSGLAQLFISKGWRVSGSDLSTNENVKQLRNQGVAINTSHQKKNISENIDLVVHSLAISDDNPELRKAKKLNITTKSYPEALGTFTEDYFTIAISGTHGKSTTASMTGLMLQQAGLDPTVILGTKLQEFGNSNFREGNSKFLLIEADEWQEAFLNYNPNIAVLTNLEEEHLDYYDDLQDVVNTFQTYINQNLKEDGKVIYNKDDANLQRLSMKQSIEFSKADTYAKKVKRALQVPGEYNLENALATYQIGKLLDLSEEDILQSLSSYEGAWRRFQREEKEVNNKKHIVIYDYAHHPTELKVTLQAYKEKYQKEVWAIFQPHQFQRTLYLKNQFIEVFDNSPVDKLIVTDIYNVSGREKEGIKKQISAQKLVNTTQNNKVVYIPFEKILSYLKKNLQGEEIIAIIGAGDVDKLLNNLN